MNIKRIMLWLLVIAVLLLPLIAKSVSEDKDNKNSVLLSGDLYRITEQSDSYYLKMHDYQPVLEYVIKDLDNDPFVAFQTVAEMRKALREQNFDDAQITKIRQFTIVPSLGTILFDIDHIYSPIFPEPLKSIGVRWHGDNYIVELEAKGSGIAPFNDTRTGSRYSCRPTVAFLDTDTYEQHFQNHYETLLAEGESLESTTCNPARNATIYYITSSQGRQKIIHYTVVEENKTLHIEENYILSWWYDSEWVSNSVPHNISIYCEQDDARFVITLSNLKERPTLEWLSEFGVEETVLSVFDD